MLVLARYGAHGIASAWASRKAKATGHPFYVMLHDARCIIEEGRLLP